MSLATGAAGYLTSLVNATTVPTTRSRLDEEWRGRRQPPLQAQARQTTVAERLTIRCGDSQRSPSVTKKRTSGPPNLPPIDRTGSGGGGGDGWDKNRIIRNVGLNLLFLLGYCILEGGGGGGGFFGGGGDGSGGSGGGGGGGGGGGSLPDIDPPSPPSNYEDESEEEEQAYTPRKSSKKRRRGNKKREAKKQA